MNPANFIFVMKPREEGVRGKKGKEKLEVQASFSIPRTSRDNSGCLMITSNIHNRTPKSGILFTDIGIEDFLYWLIY